MKTQINAQILADSISEQGHRITTFLLTYPRFIHSELLTHRMFSRNSASSRAIPFEKMVKMVQTDPFIPSAWQFDHKGMQGNEYVTEESDYGGIKARNESWLQARDFAIQQAKDLSSMDTTKQICNRLLEPFMWHTVLVTSGKEGLDNFFELRCPQYYLKGVPTVNDNLSLSGKTITIVGKSKKELLKQINEIDNDSYIGFKNILNKYSDLDWLLINKSQAEIHIQALAEAMWDAMNESTPKQLQAGKWHIPKFSNTVDIIDMEIIPDNMSLDDYLLAIATARCARLSYLNFDGKIDYQKDIDLHNQLLKDNHLSPFEHCARAMSDLEYYSFIKGMYPTMKDENGIVNYEQIPISTDTSGLTGFVGVNPTNQDIYGWCNNLRGFIPYRYLIENVK